MNFSLRFKCVCKKKEYIIKKLQIYFSDFWPILYIIPFLRKNLRFEREAKAKEKKVQPQ